MGLIYSIDNTFHTFKVIHSLTNRMVNSMQTKRGLQVDKSLKVILFVLLFFFYFYFTPFKIFNRKFVFVRSLFQGEKIQ